MKHDIPTPRRVRRQHRLKANFPPPGFPSGRVAVSVEMRHLSDPGAHPHRWEAALKLACHPGACFACSEPMTASNPPMGWLTVEGSVGTPTGIGVVCGGCAVRGAADAAMRGLRALGVGGVEVAVVGPAGRA